MFPLSFTLSHEIAARLNALGRRETGRAAF